MSKLKTLEDQLNETLTQIKERKPFSYNINQDELYKQYKSIYEQSGEKARENAIGNATALTGGQMSSYAKTVGQQAYNDEMTSLAEIATKMYNNAATAYQTESNELLSKYEDLLKQRENYEFKEDKAISSRLKEISTNEDLEKTLQKMYENDEITESEAKSYFELYFDNNEKYTTNEYGDRVANYKAMIQQAYNGGFEGWSVGGETESGDTILSSPDGRILTRIQLSQILQKEGLTKKQARKLTKDLVDKLQNK